MGKAARKARRTAEAADLLDLVHAGTCTHCRRRPVIVGALWCRPCVHLATHRMRNGMFGTRTYLALDRDGNLRSWTPGTAHAATRSTYLNGIAELITEGL